MVNLRRVLFSILFFLLLLNMVAALGVTPAIKIVSFEPGKNVSGSFTIVNTEKEPMDLLISVEGDLNQSLFVKERSFSINADEDSHVVDYSMKLPFSLTPGHHSADITILQSLGGSTSGTTYVGSALAVKTQVSVFLPYPGKYLEAALSVVGSGQGGEVQFVIPMINKGQLDLESVRANIDIYDDKNSLVASVNSEQISLATGERKELVQQWEADIPTGKYTALVTLIYDENTIDLEGTFTVGELEVELQEVRVKDFQLGSIAKFEMLIHNKWSEPVKEIYSQTKVFNAQGEVIADFKSPTYDVDSSAKKVFVSYWDTAGVKVGTYDASVFLRYGDSASKKDLKFNVTDDRIEIYGLGYVISDVKSSKTTTESLMIILLVLVIVLVLANISWFLILRKRLLEEK